MLAQLEATVYVRQMGTGRTAPFLAIAEDSTGANFDVVVKPTNAPDLDEGGLIREVIGALAGRSLALPVPVPYVVHLSDAFIQSVAPVNPAVHARLRRGNPIAFGSELLGTGYFVPPAGFSTPAHAVQQAAEILAFDCLLQNADRMPKNPNMKWNGTSFAIFDHEMSLIPNPFSFVPPVWASGGLTSAVGAHYFGAQLKSTVQNFARFQSAWAAIDDQFLASCESLLPAGWVAKAPSAGADALRLIRDVRDNLPACMAELQRALA